LRNYKTDLTHDNLLRDEEGCFSQFSSLHTCFRTKNGVVCSLVVCSGYRIYSHNE